MDSGGFQALLAQACDTFLTRDHLYVLFSGIDMFFGAKWEGLWDAHEG